MKHDYELVANAIDRNTVKVVNVLLTHNRDSVQLRIDPREDPDGIGYTVALTNESARVMGEALIKHAAAS
jgi:hypothetical protein